MTQRTGAPERIGSLFKVQDSVGKITILNDNLLECRGTYDLKYYDDVKDLPVGFVILLEMRNIGSQADLEISHTLCRDPLLPDIWNITYTYWKFDLEHSERLFTTYRFKWNSSTNELLVQLSLVPKETIDKIIIKMFRSAPLIVQDMVWKQNCIAFKQRVDSIKEFQISETIPGGSAA